MLQSCPRRRRTTDRRPRLSWVRSGTTHRRTRLQQHLLPGSSYARDAMAANWPRLLMNDVAGAAGGRPSRSRPLVWRRCPGAFGGAPAGRPRRAGYRARGRAPRARRPTRVARRRPRAPRRPAGRATPCRGGGRRRLRRPRPRRGRGAAARVLGLRRGVRVEAPRVHEAPRPARVPRRRPTRGRARRGPAVPRGLRPGAAAAAPPQPPSARRAAPSSDPSSPPRPLPIFALASRCAASPLDLDSMGSPTPCCPAGARAPLDSHHASVRYRRNNYRSPPSPGARRRGYFIIIPLPRAAAGRRAPGPARDGFCGASKVGGVRVPRSSLKGGWIGSP